VTEPNNPADTLRAELANALHDDWCGCDSWDGVNCEDYHDSEFPGSADAVLAVVVPALERLAAELAEVRASREAWAIKADRLDVIALAARYYVQPDTCDGSDCDHEDEVCVHMDELHATADDAGAARLVPWLEAERERLLTICAKGNDFVLAVAEALGMPASTSNDDLIAGLARLTRERDEAQQSLEAAHRELADYQQQYADLWRDANAERIQFDRVLTHLVPAARQVNGTISGVVLREQAGDLVKKLITDLEARPAIPADAEDPRIEWLMANLRKAASALSEIDGLVTEDVCSRADGGALSHEDADAVARIAKVLCTWCDGTVLAEEKLFGRDEDGAPMVDGDQPCPEGCAPVSGSDTTALPGDYVSPERKWPWFDGFHEAETHPRLPRTAGLELGPPDPTDVVEVDEGPAGFAGSDRWRPGAGHGTLAVADEREGTNP
jgi:hypothetical protein